MKQNILPSTQSSAEAKGNATVYGFGRSGSKSSNEPTMSHSEDQDVILSARHRSPLNLLFIVAFSIFFVELLIMFLFFALPPIPPLIEAFVDGLSLVVLVCPVLYLFLFRPLIEYIVEREQAEADLNKFQIELERRVIARTHRLEIVADLSERLSAILNLKELLTELVNQVKENFGYYHVHVYLYDDKQESLVMAEGTGAAGAQMKAGGHSLHVNATTSLVARAARTGQIVRIENVQKAEDWLPNPLLPDACSEMAVPIKLEGQIVGVLDVQEDKIAGLDEGDANLLRSLANQVAVAIRNARLFAEVESALAEAHEAQRRYTEQAWDRKRVAYRGAGRVQHSLEATTRLPEAIIAVARQQALAHKELTVVTVNGSGSSVDAESQTRQALVAPITLQDVPIGDLQLHGIDPNRNLTEGELALVKAVSDQVAQAAENLRLFEETREHASRERLIGQVTDRMRRAPDLETLMKIGVEELSRVLGPARTFVRLGSDAELGVTEAKMADNSNGHHSALAQTVNPVADTDISEVFDSEQ